MERWKQKPAQQKVQPSAAHRLFAVPTVPERHRRAARQLIRQAHAATATTASVMWPKIRHGTAKLVLFYLALLCAGTLDLLLLHQNHDNYQLTAETQKILGAPVSKTLAEKLVYDAQQQQYAFNANYKPDGNAIKVGGGQYSANLGQDIQKDGFSLTDPASNITVTLKPKFDALTGKNDHGRVVYPLLGGNQMIYSIKGNGLKEDIVLPAYQGDSVEFSYKLDLPAGTEARLLDNGGVGIYSSDPALFGNINYGSDKDRALVDKARAKGQKTNLVFGIPAPIIKEASGHKSTNAHFVLKNNELTVVAKKLKDATYPLSIDPSVVVTGTNDFQAGNSTAQGNTSLPGNDEGNIDFSTGGQVGRNGLTAGTVGTFSAGNALTGNYAAGSVAYNGYLYLIGGHSSSAYVNTSQSVSISSGTPGTWNNSANTSTPGWSIRGFSSAVAYNGYIYILGGNNGSSVFNEVWYALLCTTNNSGQGGCAGTAGTIGTWTQTSNFSTNRYNLGAVAYNGYMYVVGGCTTMSAGQCSVLSTETRTAPINADGTLGSFSTTGATALPATRFGFGFAMYNGYIYVLGGCTAMNLGSCSTQNNDTIYAKLGAGTIGTWTTTSSFTTTRALTSAVASKGYLYVLGGQQGNTFLSDVQYASINADGTIGVWTANTNSLTSVRSSPGYAAYNGYIYAPGGCNASGCGTPRTDSDYAQINTAGSTNTLNARQTGAALPTIQSQGVYGAGVIALNGYLYAIGGCVNDVFNDKDCGNTFIGQNDTTNLIRWVAINADGTLGASWSSDTLTNTSRLNGANGLAQFGIVAVENTIYAVGGLDGNNNAWTRSVFRITMNPSTGAPSSAAWTATTNILPSAYGGMGVVYQANTTSTGYIYSIGGCFASPAGGPGCSTYQTTVCAIPVTLSTGAVGACSTTTPATQTQLTTGVGLMGFAYGGGYVYLLGGSTSANNQSITIYYATLTGNGITGSWSTATGTLPFSGGTSPNINGDRRMPAVFSNGHILVLGGHNGNTGTTLSAIYDCTITPSSGDIASNCATSTQTLSSTRWGSGAATANGFVYDVGGCSAGGPPTSCSTISTAVDIYRINYGGVGAVDTWTTSNASGASSFTTARYASAMAAYNGHLYLTAGCTDTGNACTARTATVYIATIGTTTADTRLTWAASTSINTARGAHGAYAINGYLYVVGGYNGGVLNNYEYAKIASDGTLVTNGITGCSGGAATWCSVTNTMPGPRTTFGGTVMGDKIYVLGGLSATGVYQATTIVGIPASDGSLVWGSTTSFTGVRDALMATAYNGYLYMAGGYDGTNYLQDVQVAQISDTSTGAIGAWSYTAPLPLRTAKANLFAVDGYMFLVGGEQQGGTTCNADAWTSSIASNGQVHTFEQNINGFATARGYMAGAYYDGYLYAAGGNCGATAPTTQTYFAGVMAQPAVAQFSQELDTELDTNPINMYINSARDSSSDSHINFSYLSAPTSGAAFGQLTQLLDVSDATTVYAMSALNSSGTVIDGNRYYLMMFTIDDSQSFAFPEASTQETAITAYEMFYHPNTGHRLRNGSTFTNGVRQSIDAHP